MSQVALHLYRKLHEARNDEARSDAIVEAFSELEERFPGLKDTATRQHLSETELRLQREIEGVRLEIEKTRTDMKRIELEMARAMHRQTLWVVGSIGTLITVIRLLDWFLAHGTH